MFVVFLESFHPACLAYRFPRQHWGSSPSFPEAVLSRPTNGITMVCSWQPWPRRSLTRIGAFSQSSSIWGHLVRRKMSKFSAGVVNLQVWQLIGLFNTGTQLWNTLLPVRTAQEWQLSVPNHNKTYSQFHCAHVKQTHDDGLNLRVRNDDPRVSLRSSVTQRDKCDGLSGQGFTSHSQAVKEICYKKQLHSECMLSPDLHPNDIYYYYYL